MGTVRCQLAVEDIEPGHWITWVLDLPGCYGSSWSASAGRGASCSGGRSGTSRTDHARQIGRLAQDVLLERS